MRHSCLSVSSRMSSMQHLFPSGTPLTGNKAQKLIRKVPVYWFGSDRRRGERTGKLLAETFIWFTEWASTETMKRGSNRDKGLVTNQLTLRLGTTVNSFKSTGSNRKYLKRKWLQNYRLFWPESVSLTGFFNPFRFLFEVSLLVTFYPAFSSEMQLHHWGAPQERRRAPCSPLPCLPWMTPKGDVFPFGVMWL